MKTFARFLELISRVLLYARIFMNRHILEIIMFHKRIDKDFQSINTILFTFLFIWYCILSIKNMPRLDIYLDI